MQRSGAGGPPNAGQTAFYTALAAQTPQRQQPPPQSFNHLQNYAAANINANMNAAAMRNNQVHPYNVQKAAAVAAAAAAAEKDNNKNSFGGGGMPKNSLGNLSMRTSTSYNPTPIQRPLMNTGRKQMSCLESNNDDVSGDHDKAKTMGAGDSMEDNQ